MSALWENPPAVDDDRLARDVAGGVGGQEDGDVGDVLGLAVAAERDALEVLGVLGRIREQVAVAGGERPTRRDRVHADARASPLERGGLDELRDRGLRGGVD